MTNASTLSKAYQGVYPQILNETPTDAWNKVVYEDFLRGLRIAMERMAEAANGGAAKPMQGRSAPKDTLDNLGDERAQKRGPEQQSLDALIRDHAAEKRVEVPALAPPEDVVDDWASQLTPKEQFFEGLERRFVTGLAREIDRAGRENATRFLMDKRSVATFMTRIADALADADSLLD